MEPTPNLPGVQTMEDYVRWAHERLCGVLRELCAGEKILSMSIQDFHTRLDTLGLWGKLVVFMYYAAVVQGERNNLAFMSRYIDQALKGRQNVQTVLLFDADWALRPHNSMQEFRKHALAESV